MFNDLRDFIAKAEEFGDCKVVEGADWDLEIGAISDLLSLNQNSPLLIFDQIKGYEAGYRVASNLFSTPRRTALGLGLPLEATGIELVRALRDKMKAGIKLVPPVEVETGPVKEHILTGADVDVFKFPAPKWHELDGGRYLGTGSMGVLRDPDEGWINVGVYRTQVHDKSTVTMSMVPGRHAEMIRKKYWAKGLSCPVAISMGQDPMLWAVAHWEGIPWGVSEYDFAGGFRGEPVQVTRGVSTDLPIPATAEIVLEGEMVPPDVETREEGPFGEWPGYYAAGIRSMPAIRVTSILHRHNPIIQGNPPSRLPSVWSLGRHLQKAAGLWNELDRQIPGVRGVWMVEEASVHSILVIALKQSYPGHAKQVGLLAAGNPAMNYLCRFILVVDEDIDPSNTADVLWALGTRVDPATSIDVVRGCLGGAADPMLPPEKKMLLDYEMSRAIIVACKPFRWMKDFPPSTGTSPELARHIKDKWKELFS
jgi:4-hydroxy-3-polyprenylbenzoate decarboxylase